MALMTDSGNVANRHSGGSSPEPRSEAVSQPPANPIPNGGLKAWLQVVGSFMAFLNTWYSYSRLPSELLLTDAGVL